MNDEDDLVRQIETYEVPANVELWTDYTVPSFRKRGNAVEMYWATPPVPQVWRLPAIHAINGQIPPARNDPDHGLIIARCPFVASVALPRSSIPNGDQMNPGKKSRVYLAPLRECVWTLERELAVAKEERSSRDDRLIDKWVQQEVEFNLNIACYRVLYLLTVLIQKSTGFRDRMRALRDSVAARCIFWPPVELRA